MKKLFAVLMIAGVLVGCDKDVARNDCDRDMKTFFEKDLRCTTEGVAMEVHLHSGNYNGQKVYFTFINCPSCSVVPTTFGYNCNKEKVTFGSLEHVTDIKQVYNSCTKKYL